MLAEVIEFVGMLRSAGIRVAQSEVSDFLGAVNLVGADRESFRWSMEAALIKSESHRAAFERVFNLYFQGRRLYPDSKKTEKIRGPGPDTPRIDKAGFQKRLHDLKNFIAREKEKAAGADCAGWCPGCPPGGGGKRGRGSPGPGSAGPEGFVNVILGGSRDSMRAMAREALEKIPLDRIDNREILRRVRILTGWAEGEEILGRMPDPGRLGDRRPPQENLKMFGTIVSEERDRLLWKKSPARVLKDLNTAEIPFNSLDYRQSREIGRRLVMMGRKLAAGNGYRYRASSRGRVDMRRTAAQAGKRGGIPIKLLMRDRKPAKPEIVILCDLSGSVAPFSRFMLLLTGAVQETFRKTRSFAFVDAVEEVTGLMGGWDAEMKMAEILRNTRVWQTGFSDYGSVWRQFARDYREAVSRKTTIVVLGDARNNYKPDGADHFAAIAGKARRLIWLNPAPRNEWDSGDSVMAVYRPHCSAVIECRNLAQLERAARHVFN